MLPLLLLLASAGWASFLKKGLLFPVSGAACEGGGGGVEAARDELEATVGEVEDIEVTPSADDIELSAVLISDSRSRFLLSWILKPGVSA